MQAIRSTAESVGKAYKKWRNVTHSIRYMVHICSPYAADTEPVLRCNTNCVTLVVERDSGRIVNFHDSMARTGVDVCQFVRETFSF